ncbi:hypothetical protein, partial [Klebsiella pneumoniae]|uniref:hypothetical protein n=1 Tax=Klebsiella pneumoniae TaxID=573 RepID=UPI002731D96C
VLFFFFALSEEYAQVMKMLGNARLKAMCFDGVTRVCNIRGSLRQQVSVDIYFTLIKIILLKYLPVLPSD